MSSEEAPPGPSNGPVEPGDGAGAAASGGRPETSGEHVGATAAEAVAPVGDAGNGLGDGVGDAEAAGGEAVGDEVVGDDPAGGEAIGDEVVGGEVAGQPGGDAGRTEPAATLGSPYEGTSAAAPYQRPADPGPGPAGPGTSTADDQVAGRSPGQPAASLFEPIPVSEAGYVIDRPDVSQAVCTDHDVRRINLTALRPVAAAHPFPLVFSSVSGAHLYGFPSADSDVDLRGVHLLPATQVVGLRHGPQTVERTWLHDEVKLDLVTHDVGKFFRLMLRRNGYVLEQLLSPLVVTSGPVHEELIAIAGGCLTRGHAHHYRGFAQGQWELYQQTGQLKPLLYTFRVLLTGIHVIRTGELISHLPTLLEVVPGAPGYLAELIEAKTAAEQELAPELPERVGDDVVTLLAELDLAEDDSPLPDYPVAEGALHDLLVRLRLEGSPAWHG